MSSRDKKIERILLLEEQLRRQKHSRPPYKPHEGQLLVHKSDTRERYTFCGNGWGKTTWLIHELHAAMQGYNPWLDEYTKVPAKCIFVVDHPTKIDDKLIPEWRKWHKLDPKWLSKDGKPYTSRIKMENGSQVRFITHEMDPMTSESIELDYLFCDEPPPRNLYVSLTRGMREKGSKKRTAIAGTPIAAAWLRTEVYEPWSRGELDYVDVFKFDAEQNRDNLDWEEQERWYGRLTDAELRIRRSGDFFDLEGLALAHLFDRKVHIVDPFDWPSNWPCVIAVDPAQNKPHVACLLGMGEGSSRYYIDEISSQEPARSFSRRLSEWVDKYPVRDIVCDSLGATAQTGGEGMKSFIDVLNECGIRARSTSYADKDDERWMQMIEQVLDAETGPLLKIFRGNPGIVTDIENVQWTKIRHEEVYKPKLDISKKDYLACLKYALASNVAINGRRARIWRPNGPVGWRDREK